VSPWLFVGIGLVVLGPLVERWIVARAVAPIVQSVRRLRLVSAQPVRREPVGADHPRLQSHASYFESTSRELASRGFVILGDLLEYREDVAAQDGTICGWFAMLTTAERSVPVMLLVTELVPAAFVVTFSGSTPNPLAIPPTIHRTILEGSPGLDAAVEAQRRGIAAHGPAVARPVQSSDQAVAVVDSVRSHINAWRTQQPPAELLDLDLRSLLAGSYEKLHRAVKRSMRGHR
jgi:hypothetical protein